MQVSSTATDVPCVQGMGTALQRIGQNPEGTVGNGVSNDDPELVAYWTFDEGRGYVVHDVTKRGHDLYLTSEPHWEVCSLPTPTWACDCSNCRHKPGEMRLDVIILCCIRVDMCTMCLLCSTDVCCRRVAAAA